MVDDEKRFNTVDHQRLITATQILAALILDREKDRNYNRERAVDIALEYTDILLKKLS